MNTRVWRIGVDIGGTFTDFDPIRSQSLFDRMFKKKNGELESASESTAPIEETATQETAAA